MGNGLGPEQISGDDQVAYPGSVSSRGNGFWLKLGERRWVPDELMNLRIMCGTMPEGAWGYADCSCLLFGEGGAAIGLVGSKGGLARASGVSLAQHAGIQAVSVCLSRLDSCVRSLFIVATPSGELAAQWAAPQAAAPAPPAGGGLGRLPPSGAAGGAVAFLFCSDPRSSEELGLTTPETSSNGLSRWGLAQTKAPEAAPSDLDKFLAFCRLRMQLPAASGQVASVLFAFHAGEARGEPWHLEAVGSAVQLPFAGITAAALEPIAVGLASRADQLPEEGMPQFQLPINRALLPSGMADDELASRTGLEDLSDRLAAATRLAEEKRRETMIERRRQHVLQKSLSATQDSLRRVRGALRNKQYELEAWRRQALLKAQAGMVEEVAEMLESLPAPLNMEALPEPKALPRVKWHKDVKEEAKEAKPAREVQKQRMPALFLPHQDLLPGGAGYLLPASSAAEDEPAEPMPEEAELGQEPTSEPAAPPPPPQPPRAPLPDPRLPERSTPIVEYEDEDEDVKLQCPRTRVGNPLNSRPPSAIVGDAPLSLQNLDDVEDWQPLRELFTTGTASGSAAPNDQGDQQSSHSGSRRSSLRLPLEKKQLL